MDDLAAFAFASFLIFFVGTFVLWLFGLSEPFFQGLLSPGLPMALLGL